MEVFVRFKTPAYKYVSHTLRERVADDHGIKAVALCGYSIYLHMGVGMYYTQVAPQDHCAYCRRAGDGRVPV